MIRVVKRHTIKNRDGSRTGGIKINSLIAEVVKFTLDRYKFTPRIPDIKTSINRLIEKEYIEYINNVYMYIF